jgi:hypothetical protein
MDVSPIILTLEVPEFDAPNVNVMSPDDPSLEEPVSSKIEPLFS